MTNETTKKMHHTQNVTQWITSLAISVVCCAVLFVVFAKYIVDLNGVTNLQALKLEMLLERHNQLQSELLFMKRGPLVQINGVTGTPTVQTVSPTEVSPAVVPPSTSPDGLQLPAPDQPAEMNTKEDMETPTIPTEPFALPARPKTPPFQPNKR